MTRPANQPVLAGPRASRQRLAIRCRDNFTFNVGKHGPVDPEARDVVADNFPDQSRSLVIPINLGGIRGAITARFIKFPFLHNQPDSQREQHHHVAR